jgi:mono/diheme cytochrome c family protein
MPKRVIPAMLLALSALACAGAPSAEAGPAQAERLYRSKCSACHRAYAPSSRDAAGWAEVLSKMAPRAKLSDAERARILAYLQANARDAPPGAAGR